MENKTNYTPRVNKKGTWKKSGRFFIAFLAMTLGVCLFSSEASAFQVKRVIRGSAQMVGGVDEAKVIDLGPTGLNLLGGEELNTDRSLLIFSTSAPSTIRTRVDLCGTVDDTTHLLFTRRLSTTTVNIEFMVVEFVSGVTVVSGMTTVPESALYKNITIPSVTFNKSFVLLSQRSWASGDSTDEFNIFGAKLNSSTVLRIERAQQNAGYNVDIAFQVVSFDAAETDVEIRSGEVNINSAVGAGETSDNGTVLVVPVSPAVDPIKSMVVFTTLPGAGVNGIEQRWGVDGQVTGSGASLTFRRLNATSNVQVWYYLIEFKNNVLVQSGREPLTANYTVATITGAGQGFGTSTYANRSFALYSISGGSGANTQLDELRHRAQLDASVGPPKMSTTYTLTREVSDNTVDTNISWQVVELPPLNLTSPNGLEIWKVGEQHAITWEYAKELQDETTTVKLQLKIGANYRNIATGLPVQDKTYNWTIPPTLTDNVINNQLKVRIECEGAKFTTRNFDESNNVFEIKGSLTLDYPDSGVNSSSPWIANTQYGIKWTPKGDLSTFGAGQVTVSYSPDNEAHWYAINAAVTAGLNNSQQTYNWTIPDTVNISTVDYNTIGSDNKIMVTHNDDAAVTGTSPSFYIKGELSLTAPSGGATIWLVHDPDPNNRITWTRKGTFEPDTLTIKYSLNSGADYFATVTAAATASQDYYYWNVPPEAVGDAVRVKIISNQSADIQVESASAADFHIVPAVDLLTPTGSSVWVASEEADITWDVFGSIALIDLWWSKDGSAPWTRITPLAGVNANDKAYHWNYVAEDMVGATAVVKIAAHTTNPDPITPDDNSAAFTVKGKLILTGPNGGENWLTGLSYNITWDAKGTNLGNVRIKYAVDGSNYVLIPELPGPGVPASDKTWTWPTVPVGNKSNVGKIKIELANDTSVAAASQAAFTIGTLAISLPDGTEQWVVDSISNNIVWTYEKFAGNVHVKYSKDNAPYTQITSGPGVPITDLSYNWNPIPDAISSNIKVKVVLASADPVPPEAVSLPFTIKGGFSFVAPRSTDKWEVDSLKTIDWTTHGSISQVDLAWSTNGGAYSSIATDLTNGFGYGNWPVPDAIGPNTKIKISSSSSHPIPVSLESYAFTIKGKLQVTAPVTGDTWYKGDTNRVVSWYAYGTVTNVKIDYKTSLAGGYTTIVANDPSHTAGNNSYTWSAGVADEKSDTCYIRVSDANNPEVEAVSEPFSIHPKITVSAPATDAVFKIGSSYPNAVAWSLNGSTKVSTVDIYYSTNGIVGPFDKPIASNVDASLGQYNWDNVLDPVGNNVVVKVMDQGNNNVYGLSSVCHVAGSITLTQPNGNEDWPVGAADKDIIWSKAGTIGTVKIYADYGAGYNPAPIGTADAESVSSWRWPAIPDEVSNNCKIKITDGDNETYTSVESANPFHIVGGFTITSPNGSPLVSGTSSPITWTTTGTAVSKVKIEFYDGTDWSTLNGSYDNSGNYPWTVPSNTSSVNCKVRITASTPDQPFSAKESSAFWIHGKIDLTSPTSTSKWTVGTLENINFNITGKVTQVNIYSSKTGAEPYTYTIASNVDVSAGANIFPWTIPTDQDILSAATAKIKIEDKDYPTVYGTSDNFMIKGVVNVLTPSASGIVLTYGGTPYNITWSTTGPVQNVRIYYSITDGVTYPFELTTAAGVPATPAVFAMDAPNQIIGAHLKVKVADKDNINDAYGVSVNPFEVIGQVVLNAPNGGEKWTVGSTRQIRWTPTGTYTSVRIEASTDDFGSTFLDITQPAGATGIQQTYDWVVPNQVSNSVKVRVSDPDHHPETVKDTSDATFKIFGAITVTNPKTGQVWLKGQTNKDITWDATASITNVKIEYKTSGGGAYTTIAANDGSHTIGPNTYTWSAGVADENSETCYIRVSDVNNYDDCFGLSEVFAIRPVISVSEPLTGANIRVGSSYTDGVKWSLNGSTKVSTVDVVYSTNGTGGPFDKTITTNRDASLGKCDWNVVADNISNNVVVKVMDSLNNNTAGLSNVFNIAGTITVQQPNGGNNWAVGAIDKNITWTKTGTIGSANIYVDYGTGYDPTPIANVDTSAVSSWNWNPIPDHVSNNVKIKIADADNEAIVNDESDNPFAIMGSFVVNTPANGNALTVDSSYDITWSRAGSAITEVKLEYSSNGGSNYTVITNDATNSGSFPWTVPDAITTSGKIRISDPDNSNAEAFSSGFFKIQGSLTVTSPNNGTESWDVGSTYPVTWTKHGAISTANIYYSHNDGADWTKLNTVAIDASLGTWDWNITEATLLSGGFHGLIKIENAADATVYDVSSAKFEVKGAVTLGNPSASGITLRVGDTYNITWTKHGAMTNVQLHYSTNGGIAGGGSYPGGNLIATVPAADLNSNWTVADAIGANLRIRVMDAANPVVWDESDDTFAIKGKIAINAPLGAEAWNVGDTRQVRWTPTGTYAQAKLEYSTNAFSDELQVFGIATVVAGASGVQQSYDWTVPDKIGSNLKVRVSDAANATVNDVSPNPFSIRGALSLTSPAGGVTWIVGENRDITWNLTGTIPTVKLEYTTDGSIYNDIIASTPGGSGTGSYPWSVANAISNTVRVRVSDTRDTSVSSTSSDFTIKGSLTLTSPNGSEVWTVNTPQDITWTKMGTIQYVKLEYSTNGFANESETTVITNSTDATGTPPASYKYTWTVPDAISTTLKVRITNTADATVSDVSNNFFKIKGALQLTAPLGGEKWGVGTSHDITWLRTGSIQSVKIELSINGGVGYGVTVIGLTPAGGQAYTWPVSDNITTQGRIKISDVNDATVYDSSPANFSVMGAFNITAPNGSEVWQVNDNHDITWGTTGTVSNIRLDYSTDGGTNYDHTIVTSTINNNLYNWTIPDNISNTVRVQVSDASNPDAFDTSNANFKIRGMLTVSAPNGSEVWSINTHQNITWARTGSVASVKLDYSTNGFANELETYTIIASTSGAALTYDWLIPDTPSSSAKVRITDVADATVFDVSNATFRIVGSLTITIPNGSEEWVVGQNNNITWTKFGAISNVKLMYSTDGGSTYPVGNTIVASTPAANFSFSWTIPDFITNQARVKIFDAADESVSDQSDANFIIKGSVALTVPNGSETWIVGENRNITWTRTGSFTNVKLEYSTNGFANELQTVVITGSTLAAAGTYAWTVADAIGTDLKVRVSDATNATVTDVSDGSFTIKGALSLTSPNGSETWVVGESRNITWGRTGSITSVKLEYSTDGGVSYPNVIIASTGAGAGSYGWTVADAIGGDVRVRVSDASDATVKDTSDASFAIKGALAIASPNGSEVWVVNSVHDISWVRTGSISNVKLEYSTNAFADELQTTVITNSTDATGTPSGSYKYAWTIPDAISNTVKVRVTNTADATVKDVSDITFRVIGALALGAPNGGEKWTVGGSQNITWTRTGGIGSVKLEYSTNGGSSYDYTITNSTSAGALSYAWDIPDSISTQVRVKISDASDAGVFDTSDANFAILGGFAIISPNGAEVWAVDESHDITWSTNGTVSSVKLEYSTDGGTTYPNVIVASTPNNNSYSWNVPDAISITVKVRVSDAANADAFDTSNGNFKIKGALHVDSPDNGTESWSVGYQYPITWTRTGAVQSINLYYSANAGTDWIKINGAAVDASLGTWTWNLPGDTELSTQARIRIMDTSDATVTDSSNNNFEVKGGLRIDTPNTAGISIQVGNNYDITWTKFGNIPNVQIHYSSNGGIGGGGTYPDPGNLIATVPASDQHFLWDIPDAIGTNVRVRVRQSDNFNVWDESDTSFEIKGKLQIVAPNGGEVWFVGENNNIQWIPTGTFTSQVKLEYSTNAFVNESQTVFIATVAAGASGVTQNYNWSVPNAISTTLKVRVTDANNATVTDTSDNSFTIKGKLRLMQPNGAETWVVATSQNITWQRTGTIALIDLKYSTDNGSTYPNTIATDVDGSLGTRAWTIPDAIGSNLRVKILDSSDQTVEDISDNTFTIKGALTITAPNGAEAWQIGTTNNITWTRQGSVAFVKLEFSLDGGATYPTTIVASTDGSTGTYPWLIPDNPSSTVKVRAIDTSDPSVFDISDANFKIVGSLTIQTPDGGDMWGIGLDKIIRWTKTGSIESVKLQYSTNSGASYDYLIIASAPAGGLEYTWSVADTPTVHARVKISDASDVTVADTSNADFKIQGRFTITSPDGSEVWVVGDSHTIIWSTVGSVTNVKLEYSTDGGANYANTITASTANTGSYSWTIPDAISAQVRVRVSDVNDYDAADASNGNFKIKGALQLTSPNGTESWVVGTSHPITWLRTGNVQTVKLEYSTDGGLSYINTISNSVDATLGTYSWTIPDAIGSQVRVKISDTSDSTVLDTSDSNFIIKGALTVLSPNGGENWIVSSGQNVTWTRTGAISSVKIDFSKNSGVTFPFPIIASTDASTGSYAWTIPDELSTTVRVRVMDASDSSVFDMSDANLSIGGALTLNAPNGGEIWYVGQSKNITWTRFGSIPSVKLEYSTNSGSSYDYVIIGSTDAAAATYSWSIPDAIGTHLRVKVTDTGNAAVSDNTNSDFIVKGVLALTSPNGSETWVVGESHNITWTPTGTINFVQLEYSTDGGNTYPNTIIASTAGPAGSYGWTIPDAIGANLKVRASDTSDASVLDVSDAVFTVKGSLLVSAPNGGESWGVGTSRNITWVRTGSIAFIKIEYSTDGGATYPNLIVANTDASTGTRAWTIPDDINSQVRVKITNNADTSVYDTSDTNFKIVGILDLSAPDGGERWTVGSNHNITWSKVGAIQFVKLEYSTNSGATYPYTIIGSTPAGATSLSWSIPDAVSKTVKVKISDASDVNVFDVSQANFIIQAGFTITTPDGGEVWTVGSQHDIVWNTVGSVSTVKLEYSIDGGTAYSSITDSTPNTGSYSWSVPDSISSQVKVKVSDYNDIDAFDVSNNNFKIRGNLNLTAPDGGEAWIVGNNYNITWTRSGSVVNINLEYSTDGGTTYPNVIASGVSAALGTYGWSIPNNLSQSARVKITDASDSSVFDVSAANFKIRGSFTLISPNGAEVWDVNSVKNVTWSRIGSIVSAKLEYSTDGGNSYPYSIVASTDASVLSYPWLIPDAITTQVRVRVSDASDATVYDTSDANFKIAGVLALSSPNGLEEWDVSSSHNITWTVTGAISSVRLEYSTDSGATYPNTIVASTSAAAGTYGWTIPDSISNTVKVKIANLADLAVFDESNSVFKIKGQLILTAPNGGEVWSVGSTQAVSWARTGSIASVKLEYSSDGGATFPGLIIASTLASAGSFSWVIPDVIGPAMRVRVSDVSDASVFDISNANFKIRGDLALNSPNGAEIWLINSSRNITWTRFGSITNAKLEYSVDSGATYPFTIVGAVNASFETFGWSIPDNPTIQARVRISDAADPSVYDTSNANFVIRGGFAITAPNGAESWAVGSPQNITWTTYGSYANVKLWYSTNNGTTYNIITGNTSNSGVYVWTVPDAISDNCLIQIADLVDIAATDVSDAVFKIHGVLGLTSPDGGEIWGVASSHNITWARTGSVNSVKLEYSTNAFVNESQTSLIATGVAGGNFLYAWTVPDMIGSDLKVRISDANDASVNDVSSSVFRIRGAFTLISPNGGEAWVVDSTHNITWTTQGTVGNVKLEYATDGGSVYTVITNSTANLGTYAWSVPNTISQQCKVRVSDANDSGANIVSANNFKIRGDLVITAPNGGENWPVASSKVITWDRTGSIASVRLEYSNNGGTTFTPIIASTANAGSYAWTVPDAITTQALVRIYDTGDFTVTDTSNAVFKIQGSFAVTSPNGGESWMVTSDHDITWTSSGSVAFVNLSYSKDSGGTWTSIVTNEANDGNFTWTLPIQSVSTRVRVKVADATDSDANDTSNSDFRIRCYLTVTSPNGGEQWRVGQSHNITWTTVGNLTNVKLEFSRDNFMTDFQEISALAPNAGTYSWTLPDTIHNSVKVRVSDPDDYGARDDSDATFRITGDVTVTSPNGAEKWEVDSNHDITWTTRGTMTDVKIEYSTNGGGSYPNIIAATSNTGTLPWIVPNDISPACRVRISDLSDSTAYDISDANFKIMARYTLTSPNGSEIWTVGDSHTITWTNIGTVANVKLDYSTDSGATYPNTINVSTLNTGTYSWTIPDSISTAVRVRVSSATDSDAFDSSDSDFKIRGAFVLTTPNGGELWQINQAKTIQWNTIGTIASVRLLYSTNSGATYPNTIAASIGNAGSYNWTVPDTRTPTARVRITSPADTTVFDDSDADFRIQGFLTLTAPNGAESWIAGDQHSISWTWGGTLPTVKLTYSTDSGATYAYTINAAAPNGAGAGGSFSYNWTVPDTLSQTARVKVEDPDDNTVFDASNADFKIRGEFTITSPVGGERWVTNETHAITWTTRGSIPSVKLIYSKDDFLTSTVIAASVANINSYNWVIPDDRSTTVKVRLLDASDETIYGTSSGNVHIDYYNITWEVRDLLTNERLTNLSVTEKITGTSTIGWQEVSLTAPIVHPTPYGFWTTVWSASGYGDKGQNFTADRDQSFTVYLETTAVHIWRASAEFTYDATGDNLKVTTWLERDGSIVPGANKVGIYIYDDQSQNIPYNTVCDPDYYNSDTNGDGEKDVCNPKPTLFSTSVSSSGYFNLTLPAPTNLQAGVVYSALVDITNLSGAHFRTPTSFNVTETKRLEATQSAVEQMQNVTLPTFQAAVQNTITQGINEQKQTITDIMVGTGGDPEQVMASGGMVGMLQQSLTSFETQANTAITALQSGAETAVSAGQELESTAKRYSWNAGVSPDPALSGDMITLQVQGQPNLTPMLSIYSWDNKAIYSDMILLQTRPGFYVFEFKADPALFTVGKAYTYIVSEQVTGGLVSGSGMVESMGITTVAGLAAAAPEAERAAKKALDAIKAVEAVLVSNDNINIAMTLKSLKESVDELPSVLSKEGPSAQLTGAINDVSEKLKALVGDQGIDLGSILDEKLKDSTTIKEMRNKTDAIGGIVDMLLQILENKLGGVDTPVVSTSLQSGSVKFRIMVVNPSNTRTQRVQVKKYLPEEVKPKDIMDLGNLDLEFDAEKSIYYVYKNDVELRPGESRVFEAEVEDIWVFPESAFADLKKQTDALLKQFEKTKYYDKAKETADTIYLLLEEMLRNQNDDTVSREQHIGFYRQNTINVQRIKQKLGDLEKLLQTATGAKTPEMLEKSRLKVNLPSKTTTWLIILVIIIFLGLLAGVFFFVWQAQIRSSQNLINDAKESAFPGQKKDGAPSPPEEKK